MVEGFHLFLRRCLACYHPQVIDMLNAVQHLGLDAFGRRLGVKRVAHLLPVHGEIGVTAEKAIAEHLAGKVAELDVETQFAAQFAGQHG